MAAGGIALTILPVAKGPTDRSSTSEAITIAKSGKAMTIYRAPGCACCDNYADYLEENGYQVILVDARDFVMRSVEAGVPDRGIGCHLGEIDGYVVSGLVPVEIIERLLTERPKFTGITLPGMPGNAPGMSRQKTGTLKTYAFGESGISVFSDE